MAGQGRGGRAKGGNYERKIAKVLSEWSGFEITRTPGSGGFYKTGDLCPKEPEHQIRWPFSFELKNQECWNIKQVLKINGTSDMPEVFKKWWYQCAADAKTRERKPILLFTKNHHPNLVMFRREDFFAPLSSLNHYTFVSCGNLMVMLFEDFIAIPYKVYEDLGVISNVS